MQASSAVEKHRLRAQFSAARAAMPETARQASRAAIRAGVLRLVDENGWRCVAAYVPFRTEPGSRELLEALATRGVRVLVPITLPDRDLDWGEWTPDTTGPPLGTQALAHADAMIVPALAVARDGTRLGRGGGSYDRALRHCPGSTPVLALLYADEVVESLPRDPWDRPVTAVITPDGVIALE
jgi:5-formyltetrahydrofolate cyclo-ligase